MIYGDINNQWLLGLQMQIAARINECDSAAAIDAGLSREEREMLKNKLKAVAFLIEELAKKKNLIKEEQTSKIDYGLLPLLSARVVHQSQTKVMKKSEIDKVIDDFTDLFTRIMNVDF